MKGRGIKAEDSSRGEGLENNLLIGSFRGALDPLNKSSPYQREGEGDTGDRVTKKYRVRGL